MLSNDELAAIRAQILTMLPDTCNLLTVSESSDGQGGFTQTWGTASGGTSVPCRLDALRGSEQIGGVALKPYHAYVLTLPHDTVITPAYRVQIGSSVYAVTTTDRGKSWAASVRCVVEKI